jgi:hypothetical protein
LPHHACYGGVEIGGRIVARHNDGNLGCRLHLQPPRAWTKLHFAHTGIRPVRAMVSRI